MSCAATGAAVASRSDIRGPESPSPSIARRKWRRLASPCATRCTHARNAPYNLKPVGTGPYKIIDFKPGEVALYELNPYYHIPNRPFFDTVELKGGGNATSAARAVIQTGEFDFAWTPGVDKDVRERMEHQGRKGAFRITPSTGTHCLIL